jgi:hypothetical protein
VRYLLLLANSADDVASWDVLDAEEARRLREAEAPKWNALFERLQAGGHWLSGLELDAPRTAKTVRDGGRLVTDGPFAETKEQIGGFFLLECGSLDEAIELASLVPVAETGSVEIRPLAE